MVCESRWRKIENCGLKVRQRAGQGGRTILRALSMNDPPFEFETRNSIRIERCCAYVVYAGVKVRYVRQGLFVVRSLRSIFKYKGCFRCRVSDDVRTQVGHAI